MTVTMKTEVEVKEFTDIPKLRTAVTSRMLQRIVELDAIIKSATVERKALSAPVAERMEAADVKTCLVHGKLVTRLDGRPGNKKLNRTKLLKYVDVEDLEKCFTRGADIAATVQIREPKEGDDYAGEEE